MITLSLQLLGFNLPCLNELFFQKNLGNSECFDAAENGLILQFQFFCGKTLLVRELAPGAATLTRRTLLGVGLRADGPDL